jgi:hypothetical protein
MRALDFLVPGLGAAAQPLNLIVDQIFQRFLPLRLRMQKFFLLLQEGAVVSPHSKNAIGIHPAQLRHVCGNILQKIAVVTYDHAGECGLPQQLFKPLDSLQVEMVGGFIQQQNIGRLNQRLDDRQPLLPASGKGRGFGVEVFKTGAAQGFRKARPSFGGVDGAPLHGVFSHRPHRRSGLKSGILLHITDAEPFSEGHFPAVRLFGAGQNSQQSRFAGAVRANQSDPVAVRDRKRHVLKERIRSKGLRNFLNIDDRRQRLAVSQVSLEIIRKNHVGTAALGCPVEQSSTSCFAIFLN